MPAYLLFLGFILVGEGPLFSPPGESRRSFDDLRSSPAAAAVGSYFRDLELLAGFINGLFLILI